LVKPPNLSALARFYAKGLLTFIYVPDESDEAVRDLLRSRRFLIEQQTMIRNHTSALCRRLGLDYHQQTQKKTKWTVHHMNWLQAQIGKLANAAAKVNFRILLKQYEDVSKNIDLYDSEIEHILLKQSLPFASGISSLNPNPEPILATYFPAFGSNAIFPEIDATVDMLIDSESWKTSSGTGF
jgi:hypothetical protein